MYVGRKYESRTARLSFTPTKASSGGHSGQILFGFLEWLVDWLIDWLIDFLIG
jgi:hypothetical protein